MRKYICYVVIKILYMEPINISSSIGNYQKETPANFLITKVAAEKKGFPQKKFSEKKCVHRTEAGFCNRSNKQCPLFIL